MPEPKGAGLHAASLSAVAFRNGSWPLPTAVVELERTRVEARRPLIALWFEVRVLGASAAVVNILVKEDTHDGSSGQTVRHSARFTHLTAAGKSVHAPVRVGMEEAWAGAKSRKSHRDLRRRSRDPVPEGQSRTSFAAPARDHG